MNTQIVKETTREAFTRSEGLKIQTKQLAFYKAILKSKVYNDLLAAVKKANDNLSDDNGYKVVRGIDLDNWIANYFNKYKPF